MRPRYLIALGLGLVLIASSVTAAHAYRPYLAHCSYISHGTQGWTGPIRHDYAEAQRDCDTHERKNPSHGDCEVG